MFEYNIQVKKEGGSEMDYEESKNSIIENKVASIYNFLPVALLGEGTYG